MGLRRGEGFRGVRRPGISFVELWMCVCVPVVCVCVSVSVCVCGGGGWKEADHVGMPSFSATPHHAGSDVCDTMLTAP